jgi:hypothetical protein
MGRRGRASHHLLPAPNLTRRSLAAASPCVPACVFVCLLAAHLPPPLICRRLFTLPPPLASRPNIPLDFLTLFPAPRPHLSVPGSFLGAGAGLLALVARQRSPRQRLPRLPPMPPPPRRPLLMPPPPRRRLQMPPGLSCSFRLERALSLCLYTRLHVVYPSIYISSLSSMHRSLARALSRASVVSLHREATRSRALSARGTAGGNDGRNILSYPHFPSPSPDAVKDCAGAIVKNI